MCQCVADKKGAKTEIGVVYVLLGHCDFRSAATAKNNPVTAFYLAVGQGAN